PHRLRPSAAAGVVRRQRTALADLARKCAHRVHRQPRRPDQPIQPVRRPHRAGDEAPRRGWPRSVDPDEHSVRVGTGFDGTVKTTSGALSFTSGRPSPTPLQSGAVDPPKPASPLGPAFQDQNGVFHCGTPAAPIADCTPVNLFGANSLTPSMIQSL